MAALAVLAALLTWIVASRYLAGDHAHTPLANESEDSAASTTPANSVGAPLRKGVPRSNGAESAGGTGGETGLPGQVEVRIVDEAGTPVPELELHYWGKAVPNPDNKLGARRSDAQHFLKTTTNSDGRCSLPIDRGGAIIVESASEDWELHEAILEDQFKELNTLTATRLVDVYVSAVVDDGRPWIGECKVMKSKGRSLVVKGIGRSLWFDGQHYAELKRVPRIDLVFYCVGTTVGVKDSVFITVAAAEIQHLAVITITLQSDPQNQRGGIEFDFTRYGSPDIEYRVVISKPGSKTAWGGGGAKPGVVRSCLLHPGEYVVRIEKGQQAVWESDVVTVKSREYTRVAYENYLPAIVHVEVVNENREPVKGAVFTTNADTYVNFSFASESPGVLARTDAAGAARLTGIKPGTRKFLIEAEGHEPEIVEVELGEGEVKHLSQVQLRKAFGLLTVKLIGMKPKQAYTVMLLQPGGATVRLIKNLKAAEDTTEVSVKLDALPTRTYIVTVVAGQGGKAPPNEKVVLDAEHTSAELSFDVSDLVESSMGGD